MSQEQSITTDELAEMTQRQFGAMQDQFSVMQKQMDRMEHKMEAGQKAILDVLLDVPSKKVIESIAHRVQDIEEEHLPERLSVVERKLVVTP